jgi:hypothetical protein
MSRVVCRVAQHDVGRMVPPLGRHVRACLACQAELARRRRLLRQLRGLREIEEIAPLELAEAVERRVAATEPDSGSGPRSLLGRGLAAGGAVVATAVGAVVVVVRRRGHAPI